MSESESTETIEVDDEFVETLEAVLALQRDVAKVEGVLARLDTGLDKSDTQRLLWARLNGWSLSDVEDMFDRARNVESMSGRERLQRLLASKSGVTMEEADEFLSEVEDLNRKYGDAA